MFHDTLTAHLTTRPPADWATASDAHEAILTALEDADPDDTAAAGYHRDRAPEHLWALGRPPATLTP